MDKRLKKFIVLVESGSFSAAAKKLKISQPAITVAIASLEISLGYKLIVRNKKNITLTKEGHTVYATALRLQQEVAYMYQQLFEDDIKEIPIKLGFIDTIAHGLLEITPVSRLLTTSEIVIDNSARLIHDVAVQRLDAAIITGQLTNISSDIHIHKLEPEPFIFVCAPHAYPKEPLTYIPNWLAFNRESTTYVLFTQMFSNAGITAVPHFFSTSMSILKTMAIKGRGIALLPEHFTAKERRDNTLQACNTPPFYRPLWLISHNKTKQALIDELLSLVESYVRK